MRLIYSFVLIQALGGLTSRSAPPTEPRRIPLSEARLLARDGLKALGEDSPAVDLAPMKLKYAPDFYGFEATWPNPAGSPVLGFFGVNPWTGDVWNLDSCERVSSVVLGNAQSSIRRRFRLKGADYEMLHKRSPAC